MNLTSRYALFAALGFTFAAVAPTVGVAAKKEAAASQPKVGEAVSKALIQADAAAKKQDYAGADTLLGQARAAAKTPDEQYVVAQYGLNFASASKDQAKLAVALDEIITTGEASQRLTVEQKRSYYAIQCQFAYQASNFAKAEAACGAALAAGATEPGVYTILADVQSREKKPKDAIATLQKAIDAATAAGQKPASDVYGQAVDIAARSGSADDIVRVTTTWLAAYPTKENWYKALLIYRQASGIADDASAEKSPTGGANDPDLNLLRLARAAGVLNNFTDREFLDYALATYKTYPNEAVIVLQAGIDAGKLNPTTSKNTREMLAIAKDTLAGDKVTLPGLIKSAKAPTATLKSILTTADDLYAYGDFTQAAELYKLALPKAGAGSAKVNLRIGAALAQSGDKAGALAALNLVNGGHYGAVASYWKTWLNTPAVG